MRRNMHATYLNLMSRCTAPFACKKASPANICTVIDCPTTKTGSDSGITSCVKATIHLEHEIKVTKLGQVRRLSGKVGPRLVHHHKGVRTADQDKGVQMGVDEIDNSGVVLRVLDHESVEREVDLARAARVQEDEHETRVQDRLGEASDLPAHLSIFGWPFTVRAT